MIELNEFNAEKATHIVSLGAACNVAYNSRRHFDFNSAFPFDWWITNPAALESFLQEPNSDFLYDPENLELTEKAANVRNRKYGILLYHEFPREWNTVGTPIRSDWKDHIERPKSRTTALLDRFLKLDQPKNRIAFIRHGAISSKVYDALKELFKTASWTIAVLDGLDRPNLGWKGDANEWDIALKNTGLTLERGEHEHFTEKAAKPV